MAGSPYPITAAVSTLAADNYSFSFVNGQLTITKATLTVKADDASREYGDPNPAFTASYTGFKNGETLATSGVTGTPSLTATATATSPVAGSPYPITTAAGTLAAANYAFSFENGQLTITKATLTISADSTSRQYGEANPTFTTHYSGAKNGETFTVTASTTATPASPVGTYPIVPAASGATLSNYDVAATDGTLTVTAATLTISVDDATRAYAQPNPTFTTHYSGAKNGETFTVTASTVATLSSPIGAYPIVPAASGATLSNYTVVPVNGTLTVTPAAATVTAPNNGKIYGTSDPALTATQTGFTAADAATITLSATRATGEAVGSYAITPSASGAALVNYTVTYVNGTFTISKATATVTAVNNSKVYGTSDPALTATQTGFTAADAATIALSATRAAGEAVDSYTITLLASGAALSNYAVTYVPGAFSITKANASVTPNAAGKIYGSADPAFTGSLSGFLPADGVSASYSRTAGQTVGGSPYTISATLSPASVLGNYNITYNTAPFTITPKAASVTPNPAGKAYGTADPPLTGTLSGFLASDGVAASYSRTPGEAIGSYTISATLSPAAVLGNYTITYNTATFTINKATLTITANNGTKIYGTVYTCITTYPSPDFNVSGLRPEIRLAASRSPPPARPTMQTWAHTQSCRVGLLGPGWATTTSHM